MRSRRSSTSRSRSIRRSVYQTADELLVDLRALLPDGTRLDEPMLTAHLDTTWIPEPQ